MTNRASAWKRLPEDLRSLPQWALAGASKAPLSVGTDGKLYNTSVTRPGEWLTFEQAVEYAEKFSDLETSHTNTKGRLITQKGLDIGFILNASDPFTCIDLDVKDVLTAPDDPELWTGPEQFDFYIRIKDTFSSYTERSRSGKGLHIWVIGKIGRGFRREGVEVYSQERFIICTGDVLHDKPVANRQILLNNMVTQMRPITQKNQLEELEPEEDDWYVLQRAVNAGNSDKFCGLWSGDWNGLGFPSQSEADLALMSMLAFYSDSNEQCRRMFRDSGLGKRQKATKNDTYLNFTLTTIRNRQAAEMRADISAIVQGAEHVQSLAAAVKAAQGGVSTPDSPVSGTFGHIESRTSTSLHTPGSGDPVQAPPPPEVITAQMAPVPEDVVAAGEKGIPWPPGFAGKVAQFIYSNSNRQVKEVAIVAALGLLAGLTGKAWHIPQSGLNLYIILIARSAIGKEAMHNGIASIIAACSKENPSFSKFVDHSEYASGPALIKACVGNQCFVNVNGEWGRKLKQMSEDNKNTALQTLRTQMTNLYQKSGPQAIVGGIGYSSTDSNVASIAGVSYSMIGETTPGTFYEALTEDMMADGFLSRFLVIEYTGMRPAQNEMTVRYPDSALRTSLNNIAMQADLMIAKNQSQEVGRTEEASAMMRVFEKEADDHINATDDESRRQMWNRACLKALRAAAVLAVSDNWSTPVITAVHYAWAQDLIRRDIAIMKRRLDTGDVGANDVARERKMVSILKEYLTEGVSITYKVPQGMRENNIVPRTYIQMRCTRAASFYNYKNGTKRAIEETIDTLLINGYLMEVKRDGLIDNYNHHGKAYRIIKLPDYDMESKK